MNRRSVLKSLGATTIAGSAVLGSGALTQVTAERNVTISVTKDSESAVKLAPGDAATNGFADITESGGQIDFSTSNINEGGQLIVGNANADNADPVNNYLTSTAFTVADNTADGELGTDTAMGIDVSVSADAGKSNLGLLFLPTADADTDDLANDNATGGKGYTSASGNDDQDSLAGVGLDDSGTFPSLPSRYDTTNDSARFLLDQTKTVGAEMLVQADPDDQDASPQFTITVTAETVDISSTS